MNNHDEVAELPELTDDAIHLLYRICSFATQSAHPPFKSLFAAYDQVLEEQHVEQEHDAVLFRYLMRVGESTRHAGLESNGVDLVGRLRELLEAQGITLLPDGEEGSSQPLDNHVALQPLVVSKHKRRVSFQDAGVEEKWLSEYTESLLAPSSPPAALEDAPKQAAGKANGIFSGRRARSASLERVQSSQKRLPSIQSQSSEAVAHMPESPARGDVHATLLFDISATQLDGHAEAFLVTSDLRSLRRILRAWHDNAVDAQQAREAAEVVAKSFDRKTLLRQALEQWQVTRAQSRHERHRIDKLERQGSRAFHVRGDMLVRKAFGHWSTGARREQESNATYAQHMLMVRYFSRWKTFAENNLVKVRSVLSRKFFTILRNKAATRSLQSEQAVTNYGKALIAKCQEKWYWSCKEHQAELVYDGHLLSRTLHTIRSCVGRRQEQGVIAETSCRSRLSNEMFLRIRKESRKRQTDLTIAEQHRNHVLISGTSLTLRRQAQLAPIVRTFTDKKNFRLVEASFNLWHRSTILSAQAVVVSDRRILQNYWTAWNDALRCKALTQRIEDRILLEAMYRWILMERLHMLQRRMAIRLTSRAFSYWRSQVGEVRDRLSWAERVFEEAQHRRRLAFGVSCLHMAMRKREYAERAAVEFANARQVPKYLEVWKERSEHARRLAKWATDARFFFCASSTLELWRDAASERRHNRRRDAYVQIRARVKLRSVRTCWQSWKDKVIERRNLEMEGERLSNARVQRAARAIVYRWQEHSAQVAQMETQAVQTDRNKLLSSVLASLVSSQAHLAQMDVQAIHFRSEIDHAILALFLKNMQWTHFTASRRVESAEALRARNRDMHVRNMLRYWAGRAALADVKRQHTVASVQEEPESPSLRPASRSNSASAKLQSAQSLDSWIDAATPAYMRTPSRSHRRATRFRLLPAAPAVTPMAFDQAYLITTPAPTTSGRASTTTNISEVPEVLGVAEGLTPQITPFARKLRAGGYTPARQPPSALRSYVIDRGNTGTSKSVRFVRSGRFGIVQRFTNDEVG